MKKIALIGSLLAFPFVAFAQGPALTNIKTLVGSIGDIIKLLIPIVFALALLFFFWGLARYLLGGAEDKEKAKNIMIWGVVALFVMAAVWGLVRFLQSSLGITDTSPPVNPSSLIPGGF